MQYKPNMLYITPELPYEAKSGGLIATAERLRILSNYFSITILTMNASDIAIEHLIKKMKLDDIVQGGGLRKRSSINLLRSLFEGVPLSIWRNMSPLFLAATELLDKKSFDITYVDHWLMWPAAKKIKNAGKKILNLHNAEHLVFLRAAEEENFLLKQVLVMEGRRSAKYLKSICGEADEIHYISQSDADAVNALGEIKTPYRVFLPSVKIAEDDFSSFSKKLLFIGTMSWAPNAKGIAWYLQEVFPLLQYKYTLNIIGGTLNIAEKERYTNVNWCGRVDDLSIFYKDACVFIAPLTSGSGIKIKILNALAHGIPVVTTTVGVEGFPLGWGDAIHVADTPSDFSIAIENLCENEELWRGSAQATKSYVSKNFSELELAKWAEKNLHM